MDRATLLYDADCGFCVWSLAKLLVWDRRRRLRPLALQDPEARRLLGGMDEQQMLSSWHLVAPDGGVRSAGAALPPLLRLLPGGRPLGALASAFPGLSAAGYRYVAANRARLGRLVGPRAQRRAQARVRARS